jgi:hypothetical protein
LHRFLNEDDVTWHVNRKQWQCHQDLKRVENVPHLRHQIFEQKHEEKA